MKNININYGGLMGSYDIVMASLSAYSTVFLLSKNVDEFRIGLITSTANLLASFIQPWIADKVDKSDKLTLYHVNLLIIVPSIGILAGVLLAQRIVLLLSILYVFALMFQVALQPFMNAIGVYLMNLGYKINYGACRAVESAAFAVTSSILGILISRMGTNVIIVVAMIGYSIYLLLLWLMNVRFLKKIPTSHPHEVKLNPIDVALEPSEVPFFKKYRHFKFIVMGSSCLFLGLNFINLFMIKIIENVGGNTENMGFAIALAAIIEMPVMILFTRINRRFETKYLLMTAAVFFFIKATLTFLATSVTGVYFAQLTQSLSFGIYIVATVYYTNEIMEATDKVKGQAFIATAHTIGSVIGSSVGGWIINQYSVKAGLIFCMMSSFLGVVFYYFGLMRPDVRLSEGDAEK